MTHAPASADVVRDILLEGDMTIANAPATQARFMETLAAGGTARIRIGKIEDVDVTCLQLMCAFHRAALGRGQEVIFDDAAAPEFTAFTQRAGFCRHRGCRFNPTHTCLWVKEENNE